MNEAWEENDTLSYQKMKENHEQQWDYINEYIAGKDIKSVLDVGCGDRQLFDFLGEWVGIDLNTTIENSKVIKANFLEHEFDREFDMVLIAGVVEHYKAKTFKDFLKKALDVNPKYIVITLFMGTRKGGSRMFGLATRKKTYPMNRFGKESIKRMLEECKLDDYFIKEIRHRETVIVIRRKKDGQKN